MMNRIINIIAVFTLILSISSCEKVDPFVDRIVSPVLVQIVDATGSASSGLTTDPTIGVAFGEMANYGIKITELDKTNMLDYTIGIDSIPVPELALEIKIRNGNTLGIFSTDTDGIAAIAIPWSELGITESGASISLSATGSYKDVEFTKLFKLSSE